MSPIVAFGLALVAALAIILLIAIQGIKIQRLSSALEFNVLTASLDRRETRRLRIQRDLLDPQLASLRTEVVERRTEVDDLELELASTKHALNEEGDRLDKALDEIRAMDGAVNRVFTEIMALKAGRKIAISEADEAVLDASFNRHDERMKRFNKNLARDIADAIVVDVATDLASQGSAVGALYLEGRKVAA